MGVHGLWKLIESSGKPIPLETLENKVLAVDVSIWLHQAIKGFQDHKGAPVPNAHLLGIYHRVCKLLYFKIKPIFVFDGGVPALKRQTIAKRNLYKSRNASEADRLQRQLISTLLKHTAISKVLSEKAKASLPLPKKTGLKYDNLYAPPSSEFESTLSSSDDEDLEESSESTTTDSSPTKQWDLHTIDTRSHYFKSLPIEKKHEILTDLKETRKQNSWGKLHQLPKESDDFSTYQMKRLLKRQEVQSALDEVSKEMGGMSLSLAELELLLKDQGIKTTNDSNIGKRIASDSHTRYLYIKDIQEEIKKAEINEDKKKAELNIEEEEEELRKAIQLSLEETPSTSSSEKVETKQKSRADLEEEEELRMAIQLSLSEGASTSQNPKSKVSFLESFNDEDFQSESDEDFEFEEPTPKIKKPLDKKMSSAQSYMLEYSGLTPAEIEKIIGGNKVPVNTKANFKNPKLNVINKNSIKQFQKSENQVVDKNVEIINKEAHKIDPNNKHESKTKTENLSDGENKVIRKKENTDLNECKEVVNQSEETTKEIGIVEENVEVMSDSEESDGGELCATESPKALEILIDPNKVEEDDLFQDIFDGKIEDANKDINIQNSSVKKVISKKIIPIEVVIDPNKADDDDLFKDIFNGDTPALNDDKIFEQISEQKASQDKSFEMNTSTANSSTSEKIVETKDEIENSAEMENIELINEEKLENNLKATEKEVEHIVSRLTVEEMQELKDNLQSEKIDLLKEKANKDRLANNITDQMYQEAQELLELFGVPYVVAPMEAEAQCAFLDEIELTQGTITDDSDIWLFGGRTVYKNFFNQSKYVMEFKSENIEHHFKLSRQQMILLALLVGSDYTTGIQGVGPVTALEVLASFPPISQEFTLTNSQLLSGLREFKSWYVKGKSGGPGRSVLKNKLKNVTFIEHFPNPQVVEAYLDPKVDPSRDPFSWSKPDISGLTVFAKEKFGWTMKKTEDILNPVIKKLEENQTQKSIKDYFKTQFKVNSIDIEGKVSKRVQSAIGRIGKSREELIAEEMAELEKAKQKAIGKKTNKSERSKSTKDKKNKSKSQEESVEETNKSEKLKSTKERKTKNGIEKSGENETRDELEDTSTESRKTSEQKVIKDNNSKRKGKASVTSGKQKDISSEKQKDATSGTSKVSRTSKKKKEQSESVEPKTAVKSLEEMEELKDYENLAMELKARRKRKSELAKIKIEDPSRKKPKVVPPPTTAVADIPEELQDDLEVRLLAATSSHSQRRIEDIKSEAFKSLETKPQPKRAVPIKSLHTKDVIHQRLRDKSDSLRKKIKAIEVYRKSKKGPGYVPKRAKTIRAPKEDAGLSEDSD